MSARPDYGQRRVHVTAEVIEAWLVTENRISTDLPEDARFVRMFPRDKGGYFLVFESAEWGELRENEDIPRIDVTVEEPTPRVTIQK